MSARKGRTNLVTRKGHVVLCRPAVVADRIRPNMDKRLHQAEWIHSLLNCDSGAKCRTLLHMHTRTCMCGAPFDLRVGLSQALSVSYFLAPPPPP